MIHRELPRELHFSLQNIEPQDPLLYNMLRTLSARHLHTILEFNEVSVVIVMTMMVMMMLYTAQIVVVVVVVVIKI